MALMKEKEKKAKLLSRRKPANSDTITALSDAIWGYSTMLMTMAANAKGKP